MSHFIAKYCKQGIPILQTTPPTAFKIGHIQMTENVSVTCILSPVITGIPQNRKRIYIYSTLFFSC